MTNAITFISNASNNPTLMNEFISALENSSADELVTWFKSKGISETLESCKSLLNNKLALLKDRNIVSSY